MTPAGAAGPATRPENCVMGFGIPTTERRFRDSLVNGCGPRRRFVERFDGLLGPYVNEVIAPCQRFTSYFARLGVRVVHDLTLAGYSDLFRGDAVRVVILFSHFEDDAIELSDGFADAAAIVGATPEDFAGLLDLNVCHPRLLMPVLRQSRPRCDFRWVDTEMTPAVWLLFFWKLFRRLGKNPRSYLDAQVELLTGRLVDSGLAGERSS